MSRMCAIMENRFLSKVEVSSKRASFGGLFKSRGTLLEAPIQGEDKLRFLVLRDGL